MEKINEIAIIGMYARLAEFDGLDDIWDMLKKRKDCIRDFPENRRKINLQYIKKLSNMEISGKKLDYIKGAFMDNIDMFDSGFFTLPPKELELMDPNHRLFLEASFYAIEDAGYGGCLSGTNTGVFIGFSDVFSDDYKLYIRVLDPNSIGLSTVGNIKAIIASRISYFLDLKGPSLSLDTACSSSLVSIHTACRSIQNGDCDMAIAGGVKMNLLPIKEDANVGIGITSPTGRARTFDDSADGTGVGEGVVALLLKPLTKALEDRDHIHAVIKGSAINQDGSSVSITAPNMSAQQEVIQKAWKNAGIDPEIISYIEAHGTATPLGDPTEINAIQKAFRSYTDRAQFCAVGSIKSNIGHLDHLAGAAGVVKAVLALTHKEIPATINFKKPNRKIDFVNTPIYVNDTHRPWETQNVPRYCGVSSFGLSGTNCHIILEEAPSVKKEAKKKNTEPYILAISAKNKKSFSLLIEKYKEYLQSERFNPDLMDICFTANTGRDHYLIRAAFIFHSRNELIAQLNNFSANVSQQPEKGIYFQNEGLVQKTETYFDIEKVQLLQREGRISEYKDFLKKLAVSYISGSDIDWKRIYEDQICHRTPLPLYPFDRKSYWVKDANEEKGIQSIDRLPLPQNGMKYSVHCMNWVKFLPTLQENDMEEEHVVVVHFCTDKSCNIAKEIRNTGKSVIEVIVGQSQCTGNDAVAVDLNHQRDRESFADILEQNAINRVILITEPVREQYQVNDVLEEESLLHLFYIGKILNDTNPVKKIRISVLTSYGYTVTGNEKEIRPESGAIIGFIKGARLENRNLSYQCLDIDSDTGVDMIIRTIWGDLEKFCIAIRKNDLYVQQMEEIEVVAGIDKSKKEKDTILITGGTGKIGMKLARFLAAKQSATIILISRSPVIENEKTVKLLREAPCKPYHVVEGTGDASEIVYYQGDILDEPQLEKIVQHIFKRYGDISGVIHCAANNVGRYGVDLSIESEDEFLSIIKPKIQGTKILYRVFNNKNLRYFVLFSSAITVIGGAGVASYTCANAYMDAFAEMAHKQGVKLVSIDWAVWRDTIQEHNIDVPIDESSQIFNFMSTQPALETFDHVKTCERPQIIIGDLNHANELLRFNKYLPFQLSPEVINAMNIDRTEKSNEKQIQISLVGREGEQYTEIEKKLAKIWNDVLGLESINIYDSFFDIGGHSILVVKLEVEMGKENMSVSVEEIYQYPSIASMAAYLEEESINVEPIIQINNVEPFNEIYYKNCFYNSLFPVIHHFGKPILPIMINDIITYECQEQFEEKSYGMTYYSISPMQNIFEEIGLCAEAVDYSEDVVKDSLEALMKQQPVIVWVDCFYETIRNDTYGKNHQMHTLLLYGFNRQLKHFNVLEHPHKDSLSYQHCTIDFEELEQCYKGFHENFNVEKGFHTFYKFYQDEEKNIKITNESFLQQFRDNLNQETQRIWEGMEVLEGLVGWLKESMGTEEQLKNTATLIIETLTSIINAKNVEQYRMFLLLGEHDESVLLLLEIIKCWKEVRGIAARYLYGGPYQEKSVLRKLDNLDRLRRLEEKLLKIL